LRSNFTENSHNYSFFEPHELVRHISDAGNFFANLKKKRAIDNCFKASSNIAMGIAVLQECLCTHHSSL